MDEIARWGQWSDRVRGQLLLVCVCSRIVNGTKTTKATLMQTLDVESVLCVFRGRFISQIRPN
jgi:hypothetical protein